MGPPRRDCGRRRARRGARVVHAPAGRPRSATLRTASRAGGRCSARRCCGAAAARPAAAHRAVAGPPPQGAATLRGQLPIPAGALAQWSALLDERPALAKERFTFLMMTSGIGLGGADQADTAYRDYVSRTLRVGIAVPI